MRHWLAAALRWLAVLPSAVAAWLAADFLVTAAANLALFASQRIAPAPTVQFVLAAGEHLTVFASYAAAVIAAWYMAPDRKLAAAGAIAGAFLAFRLAMTLAVFDGATFTTDSPGRFLVGSAAAALGAGAAFAGLMLTRESRPRT